MKKVCKFLGTFFLSFAALIITVGPASFASIGLEEMPEGMKQKR